MGSYTGTPPTFLAGELPDADKFIEITNFMVATVDPWTDYSSSLTITASTTNPTKGNSTYIAAYRRMGGTVDFVFQITIGSSFSAGSGDYRFSLPVTASVALSTGAVWINDNGTAYRVGTVKLMSTTNAEIYLYNLTGTPLGSAGPGTAWATGDVIQAQLTYRA